MQNFQNLTREELENEVLRSDNELAKAILNTEPNQDDYIAELEDLIAEEISNRIDLEIKAQSEYYTDPESDYYDWVYQSDIEVNEQQLDRYLEDLVLTEDQRELLETNYGEVKDQLERNLEYYFTPKISYNYWAPIDALICFPIGEIEMEMEYILEDIAFPNDTIKEKALEMVEAAHVSENYAYLDMSSDSICLIIHPDAIKNILEEIAENEDNS